MGHGIPDLLGLACWQAALYAGRHQRGHDLKRLTRPHWWPCSIQQAIHCDRPKLIHCLGGIMLCQAGNKTTCDLSRPWVTRFNLLEHGDNPFPCGVGQGCQVRLRNSIRPFCRAHFLPFDCRTKTVRSPRLRIPTNPQIWSHCPGTTCDSLFHLGSHTDGKRAKMAWSDMTTRSCVSMVPAVSPSTLDTHTWSASCAMTSRTQPSTTTGTSGSSVTDLDKTSDRSSERTSSTATSTRSKRVSTAGGGPSLQSRETTFKSTSRLALPNL